MGKYLDLRGLTTFWNKIKGHFASIVSPTFTGVPAAPTAAAGTNTTQIATTEFVQTAIDNSKKLIEVTYGTSTFAEVQELWNNNYLPYIVMTLNQAKDIKIPCSHYLNYGNNHSYNGFYFTKVFEAGGGSKKIITYRLKENSTWETNSNVTCEVQGNRISNLNNYMSSTTTYPNSKAVVDYVTSIVTPLSTPVIIRQW